MLEKSNTWDENTIRKEHEEAYKQAWQHWGMFLREAKRDLDVVLGDPLTATDKRKLKAEHRLPLNFNKALRVCRLVGGYQRKHRLALKVDPIEGSDEKTASQLTGCLMWVLQYGKAYHVLSEAFEFGSLKSGINLVHPYVDYSEDPVNGDIKFKRYPYNRFMLDPNFTERDLSDCSFLLIRDYFPRETIKALLPHRASTLDKLPAGGRDEKFSYFQPPHSLSGEKFLRYDQFWVRQYKPIKTLVDGRTGFWTRLRGKQVSQERIKLLKQAFPFLEIVDGFLKTVELRILVQGEVLYVGDDPGGLEDYPYVPMMGFWTPEANRSQKQLQALVRCVRDPQNETDKRRMKILDILDSVISSGFKASSDAVVDKSALYATGQGRVIFTRPGKLKEVEQLQSADIPAGLFKLLELMDQDIIEIPGANDEMFGAPQSQDIRQAGILSKLRQAAGLTVLQDLFDNYRYAKTELGRKVVKMIQVNFLANKVKRIINEEPTKEFYERKFGKYDCVPTEGVLSDSQRQMYYAELRSMKADGAPIPWSAILDAAPVQYKSKLSEFMKQQDAEMAQQAQFQKQMEQLTARLMQAKTMRDIESARAKTAAAVEDRANAALDRVKAAKEVGKMDFEELMEILRFIVEVEQMKAPVPAQGIQSRRPGPKIVRR